MFTQNTKLPRTIETKKEEKKIQSDLICNKMGSYTFYGVTKDNVAISYFISDEPKVYQGA